MNKNTLLSALLASVLTAWFVVAGPAAAREVSSRLGITAATSTTTIPLQVRLASSGGTPTNGLRAMTFKLYTASSGGSALWSETWTAGNAVRVTDGVASVLLGSQTALPQSIVANNSTLYLGITVDVEAEMQPRVQLGSAPIAMTVPDGAITSAKIAEGAVTTSKIAATYDGYATWLGTQSFVANNSWTDISAGNYRNLTITVTRDSILDMSASVTLFNNGSGRAMFYVLVDGIAVGAAYNDSNRALTTSVRFLQPVAAGQHILSVQIGSPDSATVTTQGAFALHAVAFGR